MFVCVFVCLFRFIDPGVLKDEVLKIKPVQKQPAHHAWLDHCPLCVVQGDHAGLPPAQMAALPLTGLQHEVPRLFLDAPRPMPIWAPAQARAPPVAQA